MCAAGGTASATPGAVWLWLASCRAASGRAGLCDFLVALFCPPVFVHCCRNAGDPHHIRKQAAAARSGGGPPKWWAEPAVGRRRSIPPVVGGMAPGCGPLWRVWRAAAVQRLSAPRATEPTPQGHREVRWRRESSAVHVDLHRRVRKKEQSFLCVVVHCHFLQWAVWPHVFDRVPPTRVSPGGDPGPVGGLSYAAGCTCGATAKIPHARRSAKGGRVGVG